MSMTNRERIISSLRRQVPDKIPIGKVDFCGSLLKKFQQKTGAEDPNEYFKIPTRLVGGTHMWKGDIDYGAYLPPVPRDGRLMVKGDGYLIGEDDLEVYLFPLQSMTTIGELHRYPWWEAEAKAAAGRSWRALKQRIGVLAAQDLFVMGWVGNPFESAWKLRGFERFLLDMYELPAFAEALLDLCTEACCANARYVAQAGADLLFLYDDLAMDAGLFFSREVFSTWLLPRYRKIIAAGRDINPDILAFLHTDGKATDMLPLIIDAGFDVLNPVQPECMDPAAVKRDFGDRLSFWGTGGVQRTMPFGTPADVRHEVRTRIESVGRGGGLVLSPAQTLYSDVPWENVVAFFEAAEEFAAFHNR